MKESSSERRQARRIRLGTRVVIRTGDKAVPARAESRNISLKGIYLVPEQDLPLRTPCTVDIQLSGSSADMTLSLAGIVCRHDNQGTAITFVDLDEGAFLHLKNLVRLHRPDDPDASFCPPD